MTGWRITTKPATGGKPILRVYANRKEADAAAKLYAATGWKVNAPAQLRTMEEGGGSLTDTVLLKALIHERTYSHLAALLNLSPLEFMQRVEGKKDFTAEQLKRLAGALHLSEQEMELVAFRKQEGGAHEERRTGEHAGTRNKIPDR